MKKENWKDIRGFEGWYQVSDLGRVRSLDREIFFKNIGKNIKYKGKIMRHRYHNGYPMINLNKNKQMSSLPIHRLVAETFLDNPNKYKCVNHMDGIRSNNCSDNLEWCTHAHNNKHARDTGLFIPNIIGILENNIKNRKRVSAIRNNKLIHIADCSRDMAEFLILKYKLDVTFETASRAIRSAANSGKKYHEFNFQFIQD